MEPLLSLESKRRAAFVFPFDISFRNARLVFSSSESCFLLGLVRRFWMVRPSSSRSSSSPARQDDKRLSKQAIWSLDFEVRLGFCNSRAHIVMAAFRAIASRDEASAYARKRRESS